MSYPLFHPSCARVSVTELSVEEFAAEFPAESEWVEFKEGFPVERITKTAAAFSNTDGGVILLGVSDSGEVKGVALSSAKEVEIHNRLATVSGLGIYEMHHLEVGGWQVVVIAVARQRDGFAQLRGGQIKERRGASDRTLMGTQLADFIARRFVRAPEVSATTAGIDRIDQDLAQQLAGAWGWQIAEDRSLLMQRLMDNAFVVTGERGERLSVAGALYLTADPAAVIGKTYVEVFRYRSDSVDYDRRAEFRGPLNQQVREATDFVLDEIGFDIAVLGVERHELQRLPHKALREVVANAVAHRCYKSTGEAVRIEIHPDRVVVRSPGSLPETVTLADIAQRSVPRNVLVIRTLRFFGIAEDAGRGINLMYQHMALNFMEAPEFDADNVSVTVTLRLGSKATPAERVLLSRMFTAANTKSSQAYSVTANESQNPQHATLLLQALRGATLTNTYAQQLLGVDARKSRLLLQQLRDQGLLQQQGTNSGTTYRLHPRYAGVDGARTQSRDIPKEILELARKGPITNASVRIQTGIDRSTATRILNRLTNDGYLQRHGTKRGTHYLPTTPDTQKI